MTSNDPGIARKGNRPERGSQGTGIDSVDRSLKPTFPGNLPGPFQDIPRPRIVGEAERNYSS